MLNMGFREDMERVFAALQESAEAGARRVQKLLYSATLPHWVTAIARKYLQPGYTLVDLVSESTNPTNQGAAKVKHLAMRTTWQARASSACSLFSSLEARGVQG